VGSEQQKQPTLGSSVDEMFEVTAGIHNIGPSDEYGCKRMAASSKYSGRRMYVTSGKLKNVESLREKDYQCYH
jgi:hypothetical protein